MHAELIIVNIGKLYTPLGPYKRGSEMNDILSFDNAFIAIKDGLILDLGSHDYKKYLNDDTEIYEGRNLVALPGFVDSHTHLVYGGSRESEFEMKLNGVPYLDILKAGGGILSSVESTRKTDFNDLFRKSKGALYELGSYGVTTLEAKSGYGLNRETEFKQLEVIKELNNKTLFDIVPTYLGAHAFPIEFKNDHEGYIKSLKEDMKIVKENNLAQFVDIFCEDSVFNYQQSKDILSYAKDIGLKIKIHADEIVSLGGAGLGVNLGAASADHLMAISDEDINKIAKSNTVANLLPNTSFYLNKEYAPARKLIKANAIVSLSSDLNPGSSPSENFQLMQQISCLKLKMTPKEVLTATTINGAYNLGLSESVGSLEIGKKADILLMDAPNLDYIFYHFGVNHVKDIFKNGKAVFQKQKILIRRMIMKLSEMKVIEFVNEIDSKSPAPGGGSVSALASSMGIALTRMVGHLSSGKKKFKALDESIQMEFNNTINSFLKVKEELVVLIDKDTDAFNLIMSAFKLPKETDDEKSIRRKAIENGTIEAIKVPLKVATLSLETLKKLDIILAYGNKNTLSDLGVGTLMLYAGLEGAIMNVKINVSGLSDELMALNYSKDINEILIAAKEIKDQIILKIHSKL